jgi:type IV secretory pathway VirB10-like protein
MTTSGPAGKSAGRHAAGPEPFPVTGLPEPAPGHGAPRTALPADAKTRPPDDVAQLQQEIERAREQLGETVEQLVAKADVRARAHDKVSELAGRVKGKASRARAQAGDGAGSVRDQVASKAAAVSQKAKSAGTAVTQQLPGRVAAAAGHARQRRVPLAVAAGVLIAGYLVVRRWRTR